jgi:hypothetical protein
MDTNSRKRELVNEFSPMFEKSSVLSNVWILALIAIIAMGL